MASVYHQAMFDEFSAVLEIYRRDREALALLMMKVHLSGKYLKVLRAECRRLGVVVPDPSVKHEA